MPKGVERVGGVHADPEPVVRSLVLDGYQDAVPFRFPEERNEDPVTTSVVMLSDLGAVHSSLGRGRRRDSSERRLDFAPRGKDVAAMGIAALVVVSIVVFLTVVLVLGLFIWGAVKDGREDKALQARLGIRRRTRMGR